MRDQFTTAINDQLKTVTTNLTEGNERVLESVVDVNRKVVDFYVKTADRVADRLSTQAPALPIEVPFADRLPSPAEAGERYLDMVERLVEMNRDFNERVVSMLPAEIKPQATTATAPKPAAPKTTAKKTTAKKTTARKAAAKK